MEIPQPVELLRIGRLSRNKNPGMIVAPADALGAFYGQHDRDRIDAIRRHDQNAIGVPPLEPANTAADQGFLPGVRLLERNQEHFSSHMLFRLVTSPASGSMLPKPHVELGDE